MKRYRCPRCDTGRNAPGRMSPVDVRRFCLPCSEATGKLVTMACPAKETAKAKARQRAAEKAKRERERRNRELYFLADGTDVRPIFRKVVRLKTWGIEGKRYADRIKGMRLKHAPNDRDMDGSFYAMQLIQKATLIINAMFPQPVATDSNRRAIEKAAGIEYFKLDGHELEAVLAITHRLKHGGTPERPNWARAILQIVEARTP